MEKIKLLLYCTRQPLFLVRNECDGYFYTMDKGTLNDYKNVETYNGKIVAECDFEVEEIEHYIHHEPEVDVGVGILPAEDMDAYCTKSLDYFQLNKMSCSIVDYTLNNKNGYAIHIKNLNIFDEPKNLDYYVKDNGFTIEKAPQNMMYAYSWDHPVKVGNCYKREKYILISIKPEWVCKILNGEKTIEVRKKVLKEMVK